MKKAIIFIIAAVVLIGIVFVLLKAGTGSPYDRKIELANKYIQDGRYEEAILEYKNAIEIDPKNPKSYEGLITAYISVDNDTTITGIVETFKAYAEVSDNDNMLVTVLLAHIGKLDVAKAQELLKAVMDISSDTRLADRLEQLNGTRPQAAAQPAEVTHPAETAQASGIPADLDKQISVIMSNSSLWQLSNKFETYSYTVTDLDHNGRLEIIAASMQGSGYFTYSKYFEVNKDTSALSECSIDENSLPDIIQDSLICYENDGKYYYNMEDFVRGGMGYYYYSNSLFSLTDGAINVATYATKSDEYNHIEDKQYITCYRIDGDNQTEISENEYEKLIKDPFGTGRAGTEVAFKWIGDEDISEHAFKTCAETFFGN